MRIFLRTYGLILLLVAAGFWVAAYFMPPLPPSSLRIATGSAGGAYDNFAKRYAEILAREGIALEIVASAGSVENLQRLTASRRYSPDRVVDAALVQGGIGNPEAAPKLQGLGALFFEPVWLFVQADLDLQGLADLEGRRIAIGKDGSGTRFLALQLLAANGVAEADATLVAEGGDRAAELLIAGEIDAAFFVSAAPTAAVRLLAAQSELTLFGFDNGPAFRIALPQLSPVILPAGAIDLAADRPAEDLAMIASAASLVVRDDLHPALVDLLIRALHEVHGGRQMFAEPGFFPSAQFGVFPLDRTAERRIVEGPSFFDRYLPFWVAVWIKRLAIFLVPLLTLTIPLLRIAPPVYRWQIRRKIYRWYKKLRDIEAAADKAGADLSALAADADALQRQIGKVKVPLSYAGDLYHLRLHAQFVAARLK